MQLMLKKVLIKSTCHDIQLMGCFVFKHQFRLTLEQAKLQGSFRHKKSPNIENTQLTWMTLSRMTFQFCSCAGIVRPAPLSTHSTNPCPLSTKRPVSPFPTRTQTAEWISAATNSHTTTRPPSQHNLSNLMGCVVACTWIGIKMANTHTSCAV